MSGDAHVRFWESAGAQFPRATHHNLGKLPEPKDAHRFG